MDLAFDLHKQGDADMHAAYHAHSPAPTSVREKIAAALWCRLAVNPDRELVQKATQLFALPQHAGTGAQLVWGTCDAIWDMVGDTSDDVNWYTKRATLAGVYASTVLYWLGDDSPDYTKTRDFIDRRIANVMQIEKAKSALRDNPVTGAFMAGPMAALLGRIRKPAEMPSDLPGQGTQHAK